MGVTRFVIGFILLVLLNPFLSGACNGPRTVSELTESLYGPGSSYSKLTRPNMAALFGMGQAVDTAAPDVFYFQIQFNQLLDIDTRSQRFTVDVWTREVWYDWRLRHNDSQAYSCFRSKSTETFTAIPTAEVDKLWSPHFGSKALVEPPKILDSEAWISSNGRVWLTKRQLLTFSCFLDFSFMPYDRQFCPFPVQVISYYPDEVVLVPGIEDGIALRITPERGVFVGGPIDWEFLGGSSFGRIVCEDIGAVDGCTTFLKLMFAFRRQSNFYERHCIQPVLLCVILSYSSFFISRDAAPARVSITAIAFLALVGQINSVLASVPNLSGGVWLLDFMEVSLYFTLFANLEYAFVNYLLRMDSRVKQQLAAAIKAVDDRVQNTEAGDHPVVVSLENVSEATPRTQLGAAGPAQSYSNVSRTTPRTSQSYSRELSVEISQRLHRIDRLNVSRYGTILLGEHHVDLFSRYVFLIAYAVVIAYFYSRLPAYD